MKREYTKPTLTINEFDVETNIAASEAISTANTNWGVTVDGGAIWGDVQ